MFWTKTRPIFRAVIWVKARTLHCYKVVLTYPFVKIFSCSMQRNYFYFFKIFNWNCLSKSISCFVSLEVNIIINRHTIS